jgi:hypothetical protein
MPEKVQIVTVTYKPKTDYLRNAQVILSNCQRTVVSLLDAFDNPGGQPRPHRAPTDPEQDILRAMVLFASSGTDAMVKQIVKDVLKPALESVPHAGKAFSEFVSKRLLKKTAAGESIDVAFLSDAITNPAGREHLIDLFQEHLTGGSLQSTQELFKVAAVFSIDPKQLIADPKRLEPIFVARNYIAHEMDVDFTQVNRSRRSRKRDDMVEMANTLVGLNETFLKAVDTNMVGATPESK